MKRTYVIPEMEVVKIDSVHILAGSLKDMSTNLSGCPLYIDDEDVALGFEGR